MLNSGFRHLAWWHYLDSGSANLSFDTSHLKRVFRKEGEDRRLFLGGRNESMYESVLYTCTEPHHTARAASSYNFIRELSTLPRTWRENTSPSL